MDRKALTALKEKRFMARVHREYGENGSKTKALKGKAAELHKRVLKNI